MTYCKIYINVPIFLYLYILFSRKFCYKQQISIQICKLGNALYVNNANETMLSGNADDDASYPDADPVATQFEYWFC